MAALTRKRRKRPQQAAHVVEQQLGGRDLPAPGNARPKRVYLRMVDEPTSFEVKPGLPPGGREECRNGERPCPYIRCSWHLWRVDGNDRQGRRGRGGFDGRDSAERKLGTTVEPRWLEYPTPQCCGLDIAEATDRMRRTASGYVMPISVLANALGRSNSTVHFMLKRVLEKLRHAEESEELYELAAEETETHVMAEGCRRVGGRGGDS